MSALTNEERANFAAGGAILLGERLHYWAEEFAGILSHVSLWPVVLLFIPKINLVQLGKETAGIRFDDLILFVVLIVLLGSWMTNLRFKVDPIPAMTLAVTGIFCFSNLLQSEHSSVLYSLRLVEYLLFYWTGKMLVQSGRNLSFVVKLLVVINCAFILLQSVGLVGGFAAEGYVIGRDRPFGLSANHPAEMGALFNLLFAVIAFQKRDRPDKFWMWTVLIGGCIFLTANRSALIVHCLLVLVYTYEHTQNKAAFALKSSLTTGTLLAAIVLVPNPLRERSLDLFSVQNLEVAQQLYQSMPAEKSFTGFDSGSDASDAPQDVETSLYMRGFKWIYVSKLMFTAPWLIWIFGLGPGALGVALDGGWLRLIAEGGFVGTLAFVALLRKVWRVSWPCAMAVLSLAINMVMVDSQYSYKVMAFLFLLVGAETQRLLTAKSESQTESD